MSQFILGGWTQSLNDIPPTQFDFAMYGMITNLSALTSGTPDAPGWSPARSGPPDSGAQRLWTYGGGLCTPDAMPASTADIDAIINASRTQNWAGVDFDDECNMDIDNIIATMRAVKPASTSYTFLAGYDYNTAGSSSGQRTNAAVQAIADADVSDRFILMCYATKMWDMSDIQKYVPASIERTIGYVGNAKQVVLALTPAGLNEENRTFFLDQVSEYDIGGLFVWNFPSLAMDDLEAIATALGIEE